MPLDQRGCEGAVIVNSWLTDDPERRFLPADRRERYEPLLRAYKTFPDDPSDMDELCGIESARFDLARELFLHEEWEHFFILFSSTDWMGHQGTGLFLAGDDDARVSFLRLYEQLDSYIGWMVGREPEALVVEPSHRPVVDHLPFGIAPRRVQDLPHRAPLHVPRHDAIEERRRVAAAEAVLEERGHVDQSRRAADGRVLQVVHEIIGGCHDVAGPAPPRLPAHEGRGARVEGGRLEHAGRDPGL